MRMGMSLKNSIYQSGYNGGGPGLKVENGRLINNSPNSEMGIVQAANSRREMKREQKVQMQADAYARGEMMVESRKMVQRMIGGCSCGKPNCNC